ncbi:TIR domain-containing protein [Streptosporangium subroseum]|uniref:TIR domain-containing protein n=1 Tax=Streptosporangium subroseum TaxID=106412 RepID=UPI00308A47D3|nr:toll/interleukin-1 receptor domain-containing protein [Streptosporangium subroseum]
MTNEVFINYRTGDGERIAGLLERDLSHRFGTEHFFRASKSIPPGATYQDQLINAVRCSSVVLAVIGQDWSKHPKLHAENDWVRKEILEAFTCGIEVIPVLDGRKTERLNPADLPAELKRLADVQSVRLDLHDLESNLTRIGDLLAAKVPQLKTADRTALRKPESDGDVHNSVDEVRGNIAQSGKITGDVGTVIKGNQGPVHTGRGDLYHNSSHISGTGATYIAGDNQGGIRHDFGGSRRKEEEDDR